MSKSAFLKNIFSADVYRRTAAGQAFCFSYSRTTSNLPGTPVTELAYRLTEIGNLEIHVETENAGGNFVFRAGSFEITENDKRLEIILFTDESLSPCLHINTDGH